MKKRIVLILTALAMILSLAACGPKPVEKETTQQTDGKLFSKGAIIVKVNPEVKVNYDEEGLTTSVEALNDDGLDIIKNLDGFVGVAVKQTVRRIIEEMGNKGYLFEELEGDDNEIVLEVEKGSVVPVETFIDDIVATVEEFIDTKTLANKAANEPKVRVEDDDLLDDDQDDDNDDQDDDNDDQYDDNDDQDDDDKKVTEKKIVKTVKPSDDDDDKDDKDDDDDDDDDDGDDD